MISSLVLEDFITYFSGNDRVFGQHRFGTFPNNGKEVGGENRTVKDTLVTLDIFEKHLTGKGEGVGIVPITYNNTCRFCVIDIDIYDEFKIRASAMRVLRAIFDNGLPICVFKSKSGGFHLYIFFNDFVPAIKARAIAEKYIRLLSMDKICSAPNKGLEIFPKQNTLTREQQGSWINLPYYGAFDKESRNPMLRDCESTLGIDEAIVKIKTVAMSYDAHLEVINDSMFFDAPPCLQSLYYLNDINENRNTFLFSFGVYLYKKNEDTFASELYEVNARMPKPIPDRELEDTVLKSVRQKSYGYKCKESPLCDVCAKNECKNRDYGIGDGKQVSELDLGSMWQLASDPPEYYWTINNVEIRFRNEEELLNQNKFRAICVRKLLITPYKLKDEAWVKALNGAMSDCEVRDLDGEEIDQKSRLLHYFTEYITQRAFGSSIESVRSGRVYKSEKEDRYFFKGAAFAEWVHAIKNYREFTVADIGHFLRSEMKCKMEIRGITNFHCMSIECEKFKTIDTIDVEVEDVDFGKPEEFEVTSAPEPKY